MFRVLLTHQLVLAMVVGPMLCCCSAAHLGSANRATAEPPPGHCCGDQGKPDDHPPGRDHRSPSEPAKCPCKDAPAKMVAVPETPAGTVDAQVHLAGSYALADCPVTLDTSLPTRPTAPRFELRSSGPSTADLLYAHHNLRC